MSSNQQTTESCQFFFISVHRHPARTPPLKEFHSLHPTLRGEALSWSPKKETCKEGTKVREESKRPSGDSWASSGTNRQAFATRHSHQRVLHWWQRGLSSPGAWLAFKGAGSLGPRNFTAGKASCAFPLRQAFHRKERVASAILHEEEKLSLTGDILPPLTWFSSTD